MKTIKFIPFGLLIIGTFGLLATELLTIPESRYFTLTFAGFNVVGLVMLVLTHKKV